MSREYGWEQFVCDNCKKKTEPLKSKYPHREGWINIGKLWLGQQRGHNQFYLEDKDFCSSKCMIDEIEKVHNELIKDLGK